MDKRRMLLDVQAPVRARIEGIPAPLELEEYSHFGMVAHFTAGAAKLPFAALRTFSGSDLPSVNPAIREVVCPYTGERIPTVPALVPDVAIVHVQRAAADGSPQVWGLLGVQKEAAFAARRVIVAAEEIVAESVARAAPNRTLLPGFAADAVVCEPWGCHPSYAQGYYDRDNEYYVGWGEIARERASLERWLDEWVHGVAGQLAEVAAKKVADLKSLVDQKNYSEASSLLQQIGSLQLTPDQQKLVDNLKAEIQKALAGKAAGRLLNTSK